MLVAHELLSRNYHAGILGLLLLLLLLMLMYHGLLYHGLLYHGMLYHHGLLRRHAIPHVRLLVPTWLLLNLPTCTYIYARYTYR